MYKTLGILTSIFSFANKILMISILSFSSAINKGVLLKLNVEMTLELNVEI